MSKKRKVKVYGKLKLYEASAVGIPAYPDAVFGKSFSLVKSLSDLPDEQLNLQKETMTDKTQVEKSEVVEKEVKEEVVEEEAVAEEVVADEPAAEPEKAEKSAKFELTEKQIAEIVAKAIKEASLDTDRGLIAEETVKDLKTKSMGELLVDAGFFATHN